MKRKKRGKPSSEHEQVYHAAACCQAASLPLTARRLHGLKNACSGEGKKTGGFASHRTVLLSRFEGMESLRLLKGSRIIRLVELEHGEKNARPKSRQSTNGDAMTFAASRTFTRVLGQSPIFLQCARPRKLLQRIAQGLDTPQSSMGLGVVPTLKQDRGGATQGLQAGSRLIARRIISDFREQARSKTPRCLHGSKKAARSPFHRQQFARSVAAVAPSAPAPGVLSFVS